MFIQDPRGLEFQQWAVTVAVDNSLGPVPSGEQNWTIWADAVYQTIPNVPNPRDFSDWRLWAQAWVAST
jgi:hypothetical protein